MAMATQTLDRSFIESVHDVAPRLLDSGFEIWSWEPLEDLRSRLLAEFAAVDNAPSADSTRTQTTRR